MVSWYYVDGSQKVGPVSFEDILELIDTGELTGESYVWRKSFNDWKMIKDVDELQVQKSNSLNDDIPEKIDAISFNWEEVSDDQKVYSIKIGLDRGESEQEYGPYSGNLLRKLISEKRINEKTLIFAPGMENWIFLGETPLYEKLSGNIPPIISEKEKRMQIRKPFVARMFFHDNESVFEGICRDISIGGLQILTSAYDGNIGEPISLNVHPDNSDYSFTARGKIVRVLPGGQGFSIRFEDLSQEALDAISSYINE